MPRRTAATLAAILVLQQLAPAARAHAQAAEPFPVVAVQTPARRSHTWAYLTMAGGAGLVGLSLPTCWSASRRPSPRSTSLHTETSRSP